ncbi:YraN family protein [Streptomyces sp. NBC_01353]|uniref:YraN family protein n=1 Tax=Streptomyces sp. NBC_01353 TaxID=2903835 RepID=UPI002E33F3C8|nr:YraN family protein [Streptomyces sp. NBC_01353]
MNTTHATNAAGPNSTTHGTNPAGPAGPTRATNTTGPTNPTNALGRYGEELAARRLTEAGMSVLARNWRCGRTGEIDIVARDGDTVVICEVKTRREGAFEHPMAAVTPTKADRLKRLAACWLDRHGGPPPDGGVRIDLIGIVLPRRGAPVVTHAQGVA